MYILPKRRTLVHKAIEPRKLSAKVQAALAERHDDIYEIKYDGCHCILVKKDGKAYAFSRQGEPVLAAMDHVIAELEAIAEDNFVLFAEAWHEWLDHSIINGTFRRTYVAAGAELLEAVVFDYVPLADFEAGSCPVRYKTRRDRCFEIVHAIQRREFSNGNESYSPVRLAYASYCTEHGQDVVDASRTQYGAVFAIDGFMRKDRNGTWKAGSGSCGAVVKIKDHLSIDVKVLRFNEGEGKFAGMVGAIVVEWEGRELTIGGGKMTTAERAEQWALVTIGQPQDMWRCWIGKIVEAHGLSESQHGMIREPRFIRVRDDKTEGE
jgi:ATP-dependent DNA ligase